MLIMITMKDGRAFELEAVLCPTSAKTAALQRWPSGVAPVANAARRSRSLVRRALM
jgi:hypothetical protein